mmetsp:Transcript_44338/g.136846  ORF Transcript_44338/g.136846 Transcript_44338/m.136846 type:complete len:84 (+) Transcript_44338:2546-2797(+)
MIIGSSRQGNRDGPAGSYRANACHGGLMKPFWGGKPSGFHSGIPGPRIATVTAAAVSVFVAAGVVTATVATGTRGPRPELLRH